MFPIRIVLFFLFFLNLSAQNKFEDRLLLIKQSQLANIFYINQDYEKSLQLSRNVLQKAIATHDYNIISKIYNIIGCNYEEFSEYNKSINYFNKSLFYAEKCKNDTLILKANYKLGNSYSFNKKENTKGIYFLKKALSYCSNTKYKQFRLIISINLAWAYFESNNFIKGKKYLDFVNSQFVEKGNEAACAKFEMINGIYYSHIGDYKKATIHFERALEHGYLHNQLSDVYFANNQYSKMLFKTGNYKEAYLNLNKYDELAKAIVNKDKTLKASISGLNVEIDDYKREVSKIELIKETQNQNLFKSKIIVMLFIVVLFVLLVFILSLIRNNSFKKRINFELQNANNELLFAKEKAEEAAHLKSQFVSTISHELRTPLYGVIGITNMLIDEHKDLVNSPHLSSLKFSARYLLSLINDILQINKIEENRVVLELMTFNISDEIEMIVKSLSFLSQNNKNKVTINIDENIPEYLIGDKLRFAQIIMNLTSNALKFTKNGSVHIKANLVKVKDKTVFIQFRIIDTGIGIALIDQQKIFEKFVQLGRNNTDYQGTGLGLAIVKRLLLLFNSEIHIESELGQGTTFIFTIPFESNMVKTNEIINNMTVDLSSSHVFKVLIVEDNKINQMVTKKLMEKNHFKCSVVDDGFKALEVVEKETFDIILMDINMPLMNGFETSRLIRDKNIDTPIVALTAFDKEEIAEESITSGINDIIIKPFDQFKLIKVLHALIAKAKSVS